MHSSLDFAPVLLKRYPGLSIVVFELNYLNRAVFNDSYIFTCCILSVLRPKFQEKSLCAKL